VLNLLAPTLSPNDGGEGKASFSLVAFRFNASESPFNDDESRFNASESRFNGDESRFNASELRFNDDESRFNASESRFNGDESQFNARTPANPHSTTMDKMCGRMGRDGDAPSPEETMSVGG
jgi:hypothetical protein